MKGPLKLSLAIALALSGANAFALGLGTIQVKSGLNQPLDAEIPVLSESAGEINGLRVDIASAEDFSRVGLNRARVTMPLDFSVSSNARGQTVIKVTSKDIVREPFLDFLIEVNWAKGKLLREYTVLLDPPVTAPAKGPATVAAATESSPAQARPLAETPAKPSGKPAAGSAKPPKSTPPPVAAAPKPAKPAPVAKPSPEPKAVATHAPAAGDYGPVAQGETLSEVANATRPDDSTSVNRMMLALLKANPKAFYQDNINALKRGAILRIPSAEEIKAAGSLSDAAAAVRSQNESWAGNSVSKPTLVARTGESTKTPTPAPTKPDKTASATKPEHLALVPPRAGKGGESTSEHAGTSSGSSKDNAEGKAELARTKEALTSRDQEASELKSRVKQLEDLNGKDQRLISLKDSEIADLQAKLKQLQSSAKTPPAPVSTAATTKPAEPTITVTPPGKPADTSASKSDAKITAADIWNSDVNTGKAPVKPGSTTPTTTTSPATTTTTTPSTTLPSTSAVTPPVSSSTTPPVTTTATPPTTTVTPTNPTTTSATPITTTPSTTSTTASGSDGTAPKDASTTSTTAPPVTTPAVSTPAPVKTAPPAKVVPIEPPAQPWYQNQTVMLGGGGALLVIGLLALMRFMRKPKPVLMTTSDDIMDDAGHYDHEPTASEDEQHLINELSANPADTAASLELLRLYYAHGNAQRFEEVAEGMHAHINSSNQHEWDEAVAMGAELNPHSALFAGGGTAQTHHFGNDDALFGVHADDGHTHEAAFDLGGFDSHTTKPSAKLPDDSFDLDLPTHHDTALPAAAHDDMSFDLPAVTPPPRAPAPAPAPVRSQPVAAVVAVAKTDDFFVGEDAIGTKLDLAKAYLDMGDPEGAKSMLDEVLGEGNDTQKGEARRLLAEIK